MLWFSNRLKLVSGLLPKAVISALITLDDYCTCLIFISPDFIEVSEFTLCGVNEKNPLNSLLFKYFSKSSLLKKDEFCNFGVWAIVDAFFIPIACWWSLNTNVLSVQSKNLFPLDSTLLQLELLLGFYLTTAKILRLDYFWNGSSLIRFWTGGTD